MLTLLWCKKKKRWAGYSIIRLAWLEDRSYDNRTDSVGPSSHAPAGLLWRGNVIEAIKLVGGMESRSERVQGSGGRLCPLPTILASESELAYAEMWQKLKRGLLVALIFAAAAAYVFFQGR